MSIINQMKQRIAELEGSNRSIQEKNAALTSKVKEMTQDIAEAATAIVHTCKEVGIDLLDEQTKTKSIGSILMKIAPKLISGGLKFDRFTAIIPTLEKYQHLIDTKDV